MKTAAVIAEYNPFHNGHAYQLKAIRQKTECDGIIVIMSGEFVQRGGPAIYDKYSRAVCALSSGADLVLQLPYIFSGQTAEVFASGACEIINRLKTDYLCFGCDTAQEKKLKHAADLLNNETESFKTSLKRAIGANMPYPAARLKAISDELKMDFSFLKLPNNILALEYIKKMRSIFSSVQICPIELTTGENITSASMIRKLILTGDVQKALAYVPAHAIKDESVPRQSEDYKSLIRAYLVLGSSLELSQASECDESLINRMKAKAETLDSGLESFIAEVSAKNYTKSKVRRACFNILMNYTKGAMAHLKSSPPGYILVLGANELGRKLIGQINERNDIKLITNPNKQINSLSNTDKIAMLTENKASNLYNISGGAIDEFFKYKPVIL